MEEERRPLSFLGAAGWSILLSLACGVAVAITEAARPGARSDLVSVTACIVGAHLLVLFGMVRVYSPETSLREAFALRPLSVSVLLGSVTLGAGLYPALDRLDGWIGKRFPLTDEENDMLGRLTATPTLGSRVFLAVSFCIAVPVVQEVFFRGVVFSGLRKERTPALAMVGTAFYFMLANIQDPRTLGTVCILAVVLSWLRSTTGTTWASLAAQVAFNAVPLWPLVRGGALDGAPFGARTILVALGAAVVSIVAVAIFASSDARAIEARRADD